MEPTLPGFKVYIESYKVNIISITGNFNHLSVKNGRIYLKTSAFIIFCACILNYYVLLTFLPPLGETLY
jgi:hypothetical protein